MTALGVGSTATVALGDGDGGGVVAGAVGERVQPVTNRTKRKPAQGRRMNALKSRTPTPATAFSDFAFATRRP